MNPTATRFAPSPTGHLHLGNVRTAFFNWLLARRNGGRFVLRSEDTDAERSRDDYLDALMEDLAWLGLDWDEGPDCGGDHAPYRQVQRGEVYAAYFDKLSTERHAYPCFCSPQQLAVSRKVQLSAGRPPRYAGTCRDLAESEVASRLASGETATLRFRVERGREIRFDDLVRGPQSFASDDIGDFVIRRADGSAAFFFSNALDDSLMEISDVLRGEDHITNTPRQIMLLQCLGLRAPRYGHLSLLVGDDGAPLSKRHGASSLRELREQGFLPAAILNHLLRLGHALIEERWYEPDAMAQAFEIGRLGRAPARFDLDQLEHWQREAIHHAGADTLAVWGGLDDLAVVPSAQRAAFLKAVRPNLSRPGDLADWAERVFGALPEPEDDASTAINAAGADFFAAAADAFATGAHSLKELARAVSERTGARGKLLYMPLRAALTGRLSGPELGPLLELMPAPAIERRLRRHAGPGDE